jgi:CubicO group peptidase (beta-lactamase class C family)
MPTLPTTTSPRSAFYRARHRAVALVLLSGAMTGCTSYRIARWREPLPDRTTHIFPQRVVQRAPTAFPFERAVPERRDLDTLSVRDVDGTMQSFGSYMERRRIRAFVVIRNDTILYERYGGALTDSGTWNSFSVAKSVTSMLLGQALASGAIRSLDDSVTRYVPEARDRPDFAGVTIRHLLAMRSGFAYSRTNGSFWHDFRSSDAHFFYTTDRVRSLLSQHREEPPGARWAYKDSDTDLLALVLTRATGRSLAEQLHSGIWARIGTEHDASFDLDHRDGLEDAASGLNAVARDYARLGRLMLLDGRWNGARVLDSAWVRATTELDPSRTEPEVATWYRMQHTGYWWIPMHDWAAERDFFADGSRGQRIYVHRPTHTIIVQLAEDSNQDFPFRRIVHFFDGTPYTYPTGIANATLRAGRISADSARSTLTRLLDAEARTPAAYTVNEAGLLGVSETLRTEGHPDAADAVLRAAADRYAHSCRFRSALAARGLGSPCSHARP